LRIALSPVTGVEIGVLGTILKKCSQVLSIKDDHHTSNELAAKDYADQKAPETKEFVAHRQLSRSYLQRPPVFDG
jgi:hypothetical protein